MINSSFKSLFLKQKWQQQKKKAPASLLVSSVLCDRECKIVGFELQMI